MNSKENRSDRMEPQEGIRPEMAENRFSMASMAITTIGRYKVLLKKYWWLVIVGLVLGVGPAFVLVSMTAPKYRSEAKMVMAQRMVSNSSASLVTDEVQNFMGTQSEMIKSRRVQDMAMEKLLAKYPVLWETNEFLMACVEMWTTNKVDYPEEMEKTWKNIVETIPGATLFEFSSEDNRRNQQLILSAIGPDPKLVQDYLNLVMDSYLDYKKELRAQTSESTFESLTEQISTLEKEILQLRNGISDFRATNNVVMLEQVGSGRAQELGDINNQLSRYTRELETLNQLTPEQIQAAVINDGGASLGTGTITGDVKNDMASALQGPQREYYANLQALEKLKATRDELSVFLRDTHPKIRDIDDEIAGYERAIEAFKVLTTDMVKARRDALEVRVKQLQQSFDKMQVQASEADKMLLEYSNMQEELTRKQDMFEKLTEMLRTVDLSKVMSNESLSIMDPASPGKLEDSRLKKLLLGLILGLGIGFGGIYLINLFDDSFGTIAELREQINENILGQIPEVKDFAQNDALHILTEVEDSDISHGVIESFRNLRSSIIFAYPEGKVPQVMCVTSSVPSEGKSTVSTNLAISLAQTGAKVLLIDADIRRGRIHEKFGVIGKPGLVEFLYQETSAENILRKTSIENLDMIPSGHLQKSPGELFLRPSLDVLFNEIRRKYQYIIVDSAPLLATDDTSNLARRVDGVIFVVRGGFTSVRYTRECLKRLRSRNIPLMGLVFNRGYATSSDSYYYYYDYTEYYGKDGEKKVKRHKSKGHHHHTHKEEVENS